MFSPDLAIKSEYFFFFPLTPGDSFFVSNKIAFHHVCFTTGNTFLSQTTKSNLHRKPQIGSVQRDHIQSARLVP